MIGPALRVHVLRVGLAMLAAGLGAAPGWSAPRDQVDLFLSVDARGSAEVALEFEFPPPRAGRLAQRVGQALGAPLERPRWAAEGGTWTLSGHCDGAFRRHGLEVEGRVDPAPLVRWLRPLDVQWLTVNISHPRAGFSRCPGAQPETEKRGSTVDYFYPVTVAGSAPALRLVFGYHRAAALQRAGALVGLLLLPIGLIFWQRRSALRLRVSCGMSASGPSPSGPPPCWGFRRRSWPLSRWAPPQESGGDVRRRPHPAPARAGAGGVQYALAAGLRATPGD